MLLLQATDGKWYTICLIMMTLSALLRDLSYFIHLALLFILL